MQVCSFPNTSDGRCAKTDCWSVSWLLLHSSLLVGIAPCSQPCQVCQAQLHLSCVHKWAGSPFGQWCISRKFWSATALIHYHWLCQQGLEGALWDLKKTSGRLQWITPVLGHWKWHHACWGPHLSVDLGMSRTISVHGGRCKRAWALPEWCAFFTPLRVWPILLCKWGGINEPWVPLPLYCFLLTMSRWRIDVVRFLMQKLALCLRAIDLL